MAPAAADIASELGRLALGETNTRVDNRAPAADTGSVDINENKSTGKQKGPRKKKAGVQDKDVSLRTRLTEVLVRGTHECMVCLDKVRQQQPTWDCRNCYQVGLLLGLKIMFNMNNTQSFLFAKYYRHLGNLSDEGKVIQ